MTTLSQNNSVAGSLVLNDYLNTSLQNTQVIGKDTAVGRFEDPPAPDAGPLDHTLKPRSGNGGACSSLTGPKFVEQAASVPPSGAYKKRYGGSAHSSAHALELAPSPLLPSATASLSLSFSLSLLTTPLSVRRAGSSSRPRSGSSTSAATCPSPSTTPASATS